MVSGRPGVERYGFLGTRCCAPETAVPAPNGRAAQGSGPIWERRRPAPAPLDSRAGRRFHQTPGLRPMTPMVGLSFTRGLNQGKL